jgi:hypothetical protein
MSDSVRRLRDTGSFALGTSLRLQWLWLARTDSDMMWASFQFPVDRAAQPFFNASITIEVRDSARALFWEDAWLADCSIKTLAPKMWVAVSQRIIRSHMVRDELSVGAHGIRWVVDITHARTVQVIDQFISVWDMVSSVTLSSEPDAFVWKWSPDG